MPNSQYNREHKPEGIAVNRILLAAAVIAPILTIASYFATYTATITRIDQQLGALKESAGAAIARLETAINRMESSDRMQDAKINELSGKVDMLTGRLNDEILLRRNNERKQP